ncbi:hypothetical protein AMATHDRAFT_8710 [Amanita thiersii Skay4041]|uniref:Uncharacterized protein n=1 Tax=Amanita thiersii Skay4041 TaxID=703135 RepID=A0A2A9NDA5_9AGAR|nr:hypothetical protein AMATHDRAFT_8710 [Amanita thiersii Skay4041]
MDSIANETPLPKKWAFLDEKNSKRTTYAWLTGNQAPKTTIAPSTSFSPVTGQKQPLENDDTPHRDILYADKLDAIKYCLPLPKSMVDANSDAWTVIINQCLDECHESFSEYNPTVLRSIIFQMAEILMKREYFVNKIKKLAHSKDSTALKEFAGEHLCSLQHEIQLRMATTGQDTRFGGHNNLPDSDETSDSEKDDHSEEEYKPKSEDESDHHSNEHSSENEGDYQDPVLDNSEAEEHEHHSDTEEHEDHDSSEEPE